MIDARKPTGSEAEKRCRHNRGWVSDGIARYDGDGNPLPGPMWCAECGKIRNPAKSRVGRNNRTRGNRTELTVARKVGGTKVGPLGKPWDVEMPGYARLQVKKLLQPPSLRAIALELARIPGPEMPGFVWIEPGHNGEQLITFRLKDFAERHGIVTEEPS